MTISIRSSYFPYSSGYYEVEISISSKDLVRFFFTSVLSISLITLITNSETTPINLTKYFSIINSGIMCSGVNLLILVYTDELPI